MLGWHLQRRLAGRARNARYAAAVFLFAPGFRRLVFRTYRVARLKSCSWRVIQACESRIHGVWLAGFYWVAAPPRLMINTFVCDPHPQTGTNRARKWSGRIQRQQERLVWRAIRPPRRGCGLPLAVPPPDTWNRPRRMWNSAGNQRSGVLNKPHGSLAAISAADDPRSWGGRPRRRPPGTGIAGG